MRFGYDNAHAAATGSIAQLLPVFLMPLLGLCVDRFGKRTWMSMSLIIMLTYDQYHSSSSLHDTM